MPRDYKHRVDRRKKRPAVSPLLGVFTGLLIGLFVAFLVYIKMQSPGQPPQVIVKETLPAESPAETRAGEDKPADKPSEPRFDFYTLLPEMEIVVPEQQIRGKPEQGVPQVERPGTYYLQVGSFKNGEQADRLKAELAIKGFDTIIQKVTIDYNQATETWHRVRVGPYSELEALNNARRKLKASGIDSSLVRING
ncbi:MAG: SPOR domain-containing protein [Gammaproteobacteria bacterium]